MRQIATERRDGDAYISQMPRAFLLLIRSWSFVRACSACASRATLCGTNASRAGEKQPAVAATAATVQAASATRRIPARSRRQSTAHLLPGQPHIGSVPAQAALVNTHMECGLSSAQR